MIVHCMHKNTKQVVNSVDPLQNSCAPWSHLLWDALCLLQNCIIVIPQPFLYYQYARKMKLSCQWPSISVLKSALMIRFPSKGDALIIKLLLWFCDGFTCQTVPLGYINLHDSCSHSHSPHCSTASGYVHGNSLSIPNQPILLTCKQVLDQVLGTFGTTTADLL